MSKRTGRAGGARAKKIVFWIFTGVLSLAAAAFLVQWAVWAVREKYLFALPLFQKLHLSQGMERYEEIRHLVEAYPKFETLDEKYVAPDSLIREFIGGGIYDD